MNKSVILGLFLLTSMLMGTSLNMNMFSPAMGAMGKGIGQYYDNNNNDYQPIYEKDSYANSYDYDRQPSYNNGYDKSPDFMDSYGDRYNDHQDKMKKYECRTGPFEGFFVSSVEFCDAKPKFDKDGDKVKISAPPGILTAKWWQWFLDIPKEIHPSLDKTGENCNVNQQGPVWFLVGTPGDTDDQTPPITGSADRECTIPEGKKILFPIINTFCSELNEVDEIKAALGIPLDQPIPPSQLEEGLKLCAKNAIDTVDLKEASIDGKEITNLENFRVQSPIFTIVYPQDNVFNVTDFIDIPQRASADGYWVLVKGLEPGEHTIAFRGGITGIFETDVTYHITIEPSNNNDNKYYDYNYGGNNNNYY